MKNAMIFYFSGTGNTLEVMKMLTNALRLENVHTDCCNIEDCIRSGVIPNLSEYDALGIGYPIYAFNVPSIVARFTKMIPFADGKPVFVFKTAGEPFILNQSSSYYIDSKLRKKGYVLTYEKHFLMPYNIIFRYKDEVVKQIYILSQKLAKKMAYDIARDKISRPLFNPLIVLVSLFFRIQWLGAVLNGRLQRAGKRCNLCQKCVRECCSNNIHLKNGKIKFGWKCTMCMRCIMYCPQKAITAGLIEPLAIHGAYDFKRILNDSSIPSDYILNCKKGFFKHFRKYAREIEALKIE